MPGFQHLSPKVRNNIAQGKAASVATLGIDQQKKRSLKGSNSAAALAITFRSCLWREMFFGKFVRQAYFWRKLHYVNNFHVSFWLGQAWDKYGTSGL